MGVKGFLLGGFLGHIIEEKTKSKAIKSNNIEKKTEGVKKGDIISVSRGVYSHFGVYINKNEVISYTSTDSDIGDNIIQSNPLKTFLRGAKEYSVLIFPKKHGKPSSTLLSSQGMVAYDISKYIKNRDYNLYSSSETIARAKSRLNEKKYNLVFNNCEHFALWCKTGIDESHQINNFTEARKLILA